MGLLEIIGLLFAVFVGGGVWSRASQLRATRKDRLEKELKLERAKADAKDKFTDDPDAARAWLRGDRNTL